MEFTIDNGSRTAAGVYPGSTATTIAVIFEPLWEPSTATRAPRVTALAAAGLPAFR